jgi:DNA-binding NarL/FixJ family response regulator
VLLHIKVKKEALAMKELHTGPASQATVIIIDQNKLRRASFVNFLRVWADSIGASLIGMCFPVTPQDVEIGCNCQLVVLNLGGSSIDSPDAQCLLEYLTAAMPQVPLVLLSDLEDPFEVVTAFHAGVRGFIPASIEPDLVLQALTFILGGGSFLPPSVLLKLRREPNTGGDGASARDDAHSNGLSPADIDLQGGRPGQLTMRQLDVLALLRQGKSNKVIARDLGMREATVKVHVRQILRKLGASNRTQAALAMLEKLPETSPLEGEIKAATPPVIEPPKADVEKASLFTKEILIGRQIVVSGIAAAVSIIQGEILEMFAAMPTYIYYMA